MKRVYLALSALLALSFSSVGFSATSDFGTAAAAALASSSDDVKAVGGAIVAAVVLIAIAGIVLRAVRKA